ncbi:MAG: gp53-like domain-containing protein [Thiobacillus sp.]
MDRSILYTQEQGRSTDLLFAQRATMIAIGKLAKAMLGSQTMVEGLLTAPTVPASMSVQVGPGQIYSMEPVDASAYGILPADTADTILKQGLLMTATQLSCPAPTTAGYSINYLIEAIYQDSDTNNVVLPYFNSANPSQPLTGQNNSGTAQPTERQGLVALQVKAGAAATTGTQTTPAADSGYTGLAVVTVANGQTTITSSNIVTVAGVPAISSILNMIQSGAFHTANDTGAANAYVMALSPPITAYAAGMMLNIEGIVATNTGASTLNINGLGTIPITSAAGVLQGGELFAGSGAIFRINAAGNGAELIQTTGGSFPVKAATQPNHAVNYSQIGSLNGFMSIDAAQTLPNSAWGQAIQLYGNATFTSTLPAGGPASGQTGGLMYLYSDSSVVLTIAADANHFIYAPQQGLSSTTNGTTLSLGPGESILLMWRGTEIDVIGGTWMLTNSANASFRSPVTVPNATAANHAVNLGQFSSSLATNGWKKYPDPNSPTGYFIEQWGQATTTTTGVTVTFPITFPNAALDVLLGCANSGSVLATFQSLTSSGMAIQAWTSGNAAQVASSVFYNVKGY